jgi:RNA polymerase-binding transcription factor DksA
MERRNPVWFRRETDKFEAVRIELQQQKIEELEARIEKILARHVQSRVEGARYRQCEGCDDAIWPCKEIRILRGEGE